MENPPVSIALEKLGVPHKIFRHESPVTSFEQAASDRGQRASQVVRSILFRIAEDEFIMVLVAGPAQISWKALRKHLGRSRISMATEDEVFAVTGYRVGTVSPFGLPNQLKVLIDRERDGRRGNIHRVGNAKYGDHPEECGPASRFEECRSCIIDRKLNGESHVQF